MISSQMLSAFSDEFEKIAKDRAAKEMDKRLAKGDMAGAKRMGQVAHGDPGVGQPVAHGLQRSANRHMANAEPVHMGAGGINPKAGKGGFAAFEGRMAQRQAPAQAGTVVTQRPPMQQANTVTAMPPRPQMQTPATPSGPAHGNANLFHTPHPQAAQWAAYHQNTLKDISQRGVFPAAAQHAAPAAAQAAQHVAPAAAQGAGAVSRAAPGFLSRAVRHPAGVAGGALLAGAALGGGAMAMRNRQAQR